MTEQTIDMAPIRISFTSYILGTWWWTTRWKLQRLALARRTIVEQWYDRPDEPLPVDGPWGRGGSGLPSG